MGRISFLLLFSLFTVGIARGATPRMLLAGGGNVPKEMLTKLYDWSGGKRAKLLVVTWATRFPDETEVDVKARLVETGFPAEAITFAPRYDDMAFPLGHRKYLEKLAESSGVFFSGGDQSRIMAILSRSELKKRTLERLREGIAFAGTSAGTTFYSGTMLTGETKDEGRTLVTVSGLGAIDGVFFDTHVGTRGREHRIQRTLLASNDDRVGVGIDADGAVMIEGSRATVIGDFPVVFAHKTKIAEELSLVVNYLGRDRSYDLEKGKPLSE